MKPDVRSAARGLLSDDAAAGTERQGDPIGSRYHDRGDDQQRGKAQRCLQSRADGHGLFLLVLARPGHRRVGRAGPWSESGSAGVMVFTNRAKLSLT